MLSYLLPAFHIFLLIIIAFMFRRKYRNELLVKYFFTGLTLKCLAGVLFGVLYFFYYSQGDTVVYHEQGTILANALSSNPGEFLRVFFFNDSSTELWQAIVYTNQSRALLMVKLVSLVHFFTGANYWISSFYFSFFAFIALFSLANKLAKYFPWTRSAAIIGFLFFPSVVFWSSGISKETIAIGIIAICLSWSVPLFAQRSGLKLKQIVIGTVLLLLLWKLKYYYAGVFIPVFLASLMVAFLRVEYFGIANNFKRQFLYWSSFFVLTIILASFIHPNLRLDNFLEVIVNNHYLMIQISDPGDVFTLNDLQPNIVSFIMNAPSAFYHGIFKPQPWEVEGILKTLHAFENFTILILLILGFPAVGYINKGNLGYLVIALIIFVVILATLLSFSTPNYGTLSRYKVSFMPFLVYLLLADPPLRYLIKRFTLNPST